MSLEEAQSLLLSQGVDPNPIEVVGPQPQGRVVDQWPKPGEPMVTSFVALCVSSGEAPTLMPNLTGNTLAQARRALAARAISNRPEVRRAPHADVARDRIYRQSPAASAPVTAADAIILDVSDGPPPVRMPSLTNMTVEEAQQALAAREIPNEPELRRAPHATAARDRIYRQSPAAGAPLTAAVAIVLEVSDGPPPAATPAAAQWVVVPALQRMPEAAAIARLARDGLIGVARGSRHSAYAAGQVIETRPAAGERVEWGAPIYYALSLGPALPPEPETRARDNGWLLLVVLAAAALAAATLLARLVKPPLPRLEVRMAGPPVPCVEYGEPPGLEFEVSAEPPACVCGVEAADSPGGAKEG